MKLFVLCGNYKLGIDKETETFTDIAKKLHEESSELREELTFRIPDIERIASETFDTIQVCVNLLDDLKREGLDIDHAVNLHNMKLIDRGWTFKKALEVKKV